MRAAVAAALKIRDQNTINFRDRAYREEDGCTPTDLNGKLNSGGPLIDFPQKQQRPELWLPFSTVISIASPRIRSTSS